MNFSKHNSSGRFANFSSNRRSRTNRSLYVSSNSKSNSKSKSKSNTKNRFSKKEKNEINVNSTTLFPALSDKCTAKADNNNQNNSKTNDTFLNKALDKDNDIKDKPKDTESNKVKNLPVGWVRLSATNSSTPSEKELSYLKNKYENEKKKTMVANIWNSLRHIQKERDMFNEVLGSASPYYECYNIMGPPGESDEEYDDDEYYYSSSEGTDDEHEYE